MSARLTNPDRVLYPEQGLTKADLAQYYCAVAERILPHLADRPLTIVRCPRGRSECFYQKHPGDSLPAEIGRVEIPEKEGRGTYMHVSNVDGLVALVQVGALELHVWGSRLASLEKPDRLVLDLDPDEGLPFERVVTAARDVRARLLERGLESFVLATGGKGLHVVAPLEPRHGFDDVKRLASDVAHEMERDAPELYVAQASKAKRSGRVFVDWLRNARGATAICPFSTRARVGAPVATPLRWDELGRLGSASKYGVANLQRRLGALTRSGDRRSGDRRSPDPWAGYFDVRQRIRNGS